ncbi:MAG: lipoprotein [Pseudomonadota bacterium]
MRTCTLLALVGLTLAACGQTGALTLPTKEGEVVSKSPGADAAAAADSTSTAPAIVPGDTPADGEAARKREARQPATQ